MVRRYYNSVDNVSQLKKKRMGSVLNKQAPDFNACEGHVGLKNQGATCYLNTLLQTWFMTPEVSECIASVNSNTAFVCELKKIFKDLEGREKTCLGTDKLTRILKINVYQQCDIEVCFRNMITKLCTEMDEDHNILKFYQIFMVQSMKCSLCRNLVEVDFPLLDLPLHLHSADSADLDFHTANLFTPAYIFFQPIVHS
ncbi:ubiquitin carboxyl-terminal hydrolase 7-like [Pristis pectinata]|uniref:ubiquitin carboxyl-terminal hydrolase 7-like n=1 Tax=Pristis pectinata TaxID=685728 RepID=UPI00223D02DD|nr:ubiquitin carboxyl-terminal hydrolase 7-like [Pristis pectinata]